MTMPTKWAAKRLAVEVAEMAAWMEEERVRVLEKARVAEETWQAVVMVRRVEEAGEREETAREAWAAAAGVAARVGRSARSWAAAARSAAVAAWIVEEP